jgi:hypothetical protein
MTSPSQDMQATGRVKVVFVPSIADITGPTVAELTATGSVDLSCFIKSDGRTHSISQATIDAGKLCDTVNYQLPGSVTHTWTLTYARKQVTADDKAYATLKANTAGYLVERFGSAATAAFVAADVVNVYTVTCGEQVEKADKDDIVWVDAQNLFVSGATERDAVVAA